MLFSFVFFLLLFLGIGVASLLKNKHTTIDYLVATHSVNPIVVGLSAAATNNSGYMFIGMIGFTYLTGLSSIWLMIGWITGDFLVSLLVVPHLRQVSQQSDVYSFSGVLSDWYGRPFYCLRRLAGFISLMFLIVYSAAQLKAGSKALHVLFGFHENIGAILGSLIVLIYCFIGGIRASFWTDVAQSIVMLTAMIIIVFSGIASLGGYSEVMQKLQEISPTYMNLFPPNQALGPLFGPLFFVLGWLFAGFSVVGQPHIMLRFMSLDSLKHIWKARFYYYSWYFLFFILTILAGLLCRLIIADTHDFDPELALPLIAVKLTPGPLAGLIIAGIFAATMSTADSQILACTASVTGDFRKKHVTNYWVVKLSTILISLLSLLIALEAHETVFTLVVVSWGVLGSSFVPLVVLYSLGRKISESLSIATVSVGFITALCFRFFLGNLGLYEALPGILAGFIPILIYDWKR